MTTVKTDGKFSGYDIEGLGKRPRMGEANRMTWLQANGWAPTRPELIMQVVDTETGLLAVSSITANLQIRTNAGAGVFTRQIAERVAALAAP